MSDLVLKTLEELQEQLPNGLHDARLLALTHDYVRAMVTLDLKLWVSDLMEEGDDCYRPARLTLQGVAFLSIEPPDRRYDFDRARALDLKDAFPHAEMRNPSPLPPVPAGCFCNAFFINDWNAHLIIAARSVTFEWAGEPEVPAV